jgi:ApaG protein
MKPEVTAVTRGVRVEVQTRFLPEQSSPDSFVFAYTIRISNEGSETVRLRTRHWIITDAQGGLREVKGDGVVGAQPTLSPGRNFEYTSGCVLPTLRGTMHGTYQMERADGSEFDAEIPLFVLAAPDDRVSTRWLN